MKNSNIVDSVKLKVESCGIACGDDFDFVLWVFFCSFVKINENTF